jgi:hypothetical protein
MRTYQVMNDDTRSTPARIEDDVATNPPRAPWDEPEPARPLPKGWASCLLLVWFWYTVAVVAATLIVQALLAG